jgi:hypothetical protein
LEKEVEKRLKQKLKDLDRRILCLKFVSPGYSGVPDRIVILPNGNIFFVELKKPKKQERARQVYVQECMRDLGCRIYSSVDSYEKIDEIVEDCRRAIEND